MSKVLGDRPFGYPMKMALGYGRFQDAGQSLYGSVKEGASPNGLLIHQRARCWTYSFPRLFSNQNSGVGKYIDSIGR